MKYVVIVGDGMADMPLAELGGKTPLQKARTPNMDKLAREGRLGRVRTVPKACTRALMLRTSASWAMIPVSIIPAGPLLRPQVSA